jgi:filamentous hemagglutinin family protein
MVAKPCNRLLAYAGVLIGCCSATTTWAGATLDGSTGSTGSFSGNFNIQESVGTTKGSNLFHSFSEFNINTGESATFFGSSKINNVITRVTGSGTSTFNGTLTSLIDPSVGQQTGANFYFINPNGVIFKEGANLNIGGTFTATTSNYVNLGQDGVYYADLNTTSTLTSSPPSAFGFLDSNPGKISFEGTQMVRFVNTNPATPVFSFIGGDITLDQAPDGTATTFGTADSRGTFLTGNRVELISVASAGEVTSSNGVYNLDSFAALGKIDILNGSVIDATATYIKGGKITVSNSIIAPGFFFVADMAPFAPNGGSVTIEGSESVSFLGTGGPLEIIVNVPPRGPGDPDAGPRLITRFDGGPLFTGVSVFAGDPFQNSPPSDVPDVLIQGGDISLSDSAGISSQRFGPGAAGDITLNGDTVEIRNGSVIVNLNTYAGAGGDITINASKVILDSEGNTTPATGLTGLLASSAFSPVFGDPTLDPNFNGSGPPDRSLIFAPDLSSAYAGNITINANGAGGLVVLGADITTESRSFGKAGNITVNATDIVLSREGGKTGAIISQSGLAGDAGQIDINATGNIELKDGYVISASTSGTGTGGNVTVTAGKAITINGVNVGQGSSGIASATVLPPAELEGFLASLYGFPDFQTMVLVLYQGNPPPDADLFDALAALKGIGFTDLDGANPVAGNAGNVSIAATSLSITGDHAISSSTSSDGNGGAISVQVETLSLEDGAEIRSRSGISDAESGELLVGAGNGGDISVVASKSVNMKKGASISSSSLGTGLAGDISIDAGNELNLSDSSISTQATVSDGGNIKIVAIKQVYLSQSEITTSVESGTGGGGNIDIDPKFVILQQSKILANAFGGHGGNINIVAGNFIATPDSIVDASSALGIDGTVNISSPEDTVADELAVLPDQYLDVTSLISDRCGTAAGASSLVDAGPGGRAVDPDGYLPSFAVNTHYNNEEKNGEKSVSKGKHWWASFANQPTLQLAQIDCKY